jgi:carbon-monoxide dehydrogenase medium subunit
MKRFEYYQPHTLDEAYDYMGRFQGGAKYIAGGTDVIIRLKQRAIKLDALVSLRGISCLSGIKANGELILGGMTLLRDIERNGHVKQHFPALHQAVWVLANPQVRNVATIGGNLCNAAPSADCAPPLLVMEATVRLEGPGGKREVSIEAFFRGPGATVLEPGEILTAITIPQLPSRTGTAFIKMGRVSQDIAKINAAALVVMEGDICVRCRLAAGAVAPVPLRLKGCERLMEGKRIDSSLLEEVAEAASKEVRPITDVRSTEQYRRQVTGVLVKRALGDALHISSF